MKTTFSLSRLLGWAGGGFLVCTLLSGFARGNEAGAVQRRWETLQAINWVENPTNSPKPGSDGELGPYQFRASTWRMHTTRSFKQAVDRRYADQVAVKHYEWLKRGLERNGLEATPYRIAMGWNAGLSAVLRNDVGRSTKEYAHQVQNLADSLRDRNVVSDVGR